MATPWNNLPGGSDTTSAPPSNGTIVKLLDVWEYPPNEEPPGTSSGSVTRESVISNLLQQMQGPQTQRLKPSKIVVLKLRVSDQDLESGRWRSREWSLPEFTRRNNRKTSSGTKRRKTTNDSGYRGRLDRKTGDSSESAAQTIRLRPAHPEVEYEHYVPKMRTSQGNPPEARIVPTAKIWRTEMEIDDDQEIMAETNKFDKQMRLVTIDDFVGPTPLSFPFIYKPTLVEFNQMNLAEHTQNIKSEGQKTVQQNNDDKAVPLTGVFEPTEVVTRPSEVSPASDVNIVHDNINKDTNTQSTFHHQNATFIINRKLRCQNCNTETRFVLINQPQHCDKCGKLITNQYTRQNGRSRVPLEDLKMVKDCTEPVQVAKPETEENQPSRRKKRYVNTSDFWMDKYIRDQARASTNTDFKMMMLTMMRMKNENNVPKSIIPIMKGEMPNDTDVTSFIAYGNLGLQGGYRQVGRLRLVLEGNCSRADQLPWDRLLTDIKIRARILRRVRRHRSVFAQDAAKWATWDTKRRRLSRGEFTEDTSEGVWVLRKPGEDGGEGQEVKRLILGYCREGLDRGDGAFEERIGEHWVELSELRQQYRNTEVSEEAIVDEGAE